MCSVDRACSVSHTNITADVILTMVAVARQLFILYDNFDERSVYFTVATIYIMSWLYFNNPLIVSDMFI